ncbi:MAG TPA: SDR family oxidoreductase [Solirubrobacteraceae bacterium]|nr:SDR family oxidoreductase [Solirubrobacteraceae bacterium]
MTGGGGGIGGAVVRAFAEAGHRVLAVDREPSPDVFPADLVDASQAAGAADAALERFGRLDVVVCAHGGSGRRFGDGPVYECSEEGWDATLELNLKSVYLPDGIRCNVVCPGLIATPMSARAQEDEAIRARLGKLQPLTGDFGRPEDVAEAVLHLATSPFTTGSVLTVDGGWTAR